MEAMVSRVDSEQFGVQPILSGWKIGHLHRPIDTGHARELHPGRILGMVGDLDTDPLQRLPLVLDHDEEIPAHLNAMVYTTNK
jgi:hypothetical protein